MRRTVKRFVTLADIRVNRRWWHIVAAPKWAYREVNQEYWTGREPIPSAWRNVLRQVQRRADADYRRRLAEHEESQKRAAASEGLRWMLGYPKPTPTLVRPPTCLRYCAVCDNEFCGSWHGRACKYCSKQCYAKRDRPPRPSRAKAKATIPCAVCGEDFEQSRRDARYCSVCCRVAAFRKQ